MGVQARIELGRILRKMPPDWSLDFYVLLLHQELSETAMQFPALHKLGAPGEAAPTTKFLSKLQEIEVKVNIADRRDGLRSA